MRLLTAAEARGLDRRAMDELGIPGLVLMENAGRGAADELRRRWPHLVPGPVLVLAGKGNNGGDGYVIARHLLQAGWQVRTIVLAPPGLITGDAGVNLQILSRCGGHVSFAPDTEALDGLLKTSESRIVVDALFGTGLSSEIRGHYALAIDWINEAGRPVMAVDIASGIDATSGRVLGRGVRADLTVTFAAAKIGQVIEPGAGAGGELKVIDIGIPGCLISALPGDCRFVESAEARELLPARPTAGHKGTFGHLLVVAGSAGKTGAAAMTAEGGLRVGAGLVTLGCPREAHPVLAAKLTEAMTHPLPGGDYLDLTSLPDLSQLWNGKDVLALGPGLGQAEGTFELIREVVRTCPLPLVLDADGINALTGHPSLLLSRSAPTVLTPHPGEMARLVGGSVSGVEADRIGAARTFARRFQVVLVLKGARTVVALPDGRIRINSTGNPGLASGGMGDVLTGMIGGLLAQGRSAGDSAVLGVYLHGLAADRLRQNMGPAGMIATDLLREVPAARNSLCSG